MSFLSESLLSGWSISDAERQGTTDGHSGRTKVRAYTWDVCRSLKLEKMGTWVSTGFKTPLRQFNGSLGKVVAFTCESEGR